MSNVAAATLKQHPLSSAWVSMNDEDFQALKDSIENIGVQNPITLFDGMVIDGWHRYTAATELGMNCPAVELGDVDPCDFVMAQNKHRRHTTQSQMAMAATEVNAWRATAGRPVNCAGPAQLPKTSQEMAQAAGVGVRSIVQAKAVKTKAAPEVIDAVKRGELGLEKAAAIAKLPKEQQAEAISKPLPASKPKAAEPAEPETNDVGGAYEVSEEEIAEAQAAEAETLALFRKAMEGDDPLAVALRENARLQAENDGLRSRLDGLLNEKNEAVRLAKGLRRRLEAMEKEAT